MFLISKLCSVLLCLCGFCVFVNSQIAIMEHGELVTYACDDEDSECSEYFGELSICENQMCFCKNNSQFETFHCVPTSSLEPTQMPITEPIEPFAATRPTYEEMEIACDEDSECSDNFGELAICMNEICFCKNDSKFNSSHCVPISSVKPTQTSTQMPITKPEQPVVPFVATRTMACNTNRECVVQNSECVNRTCVCQKSFIMSKNRTKCLPVAEELGWGCEEDLQCTALLNKTTECQGFTCTCKAGLENKNGACVEMKGLEGFCMSSIVCETEHSECSQGVCACKAGYVTSSDSMRCLEVAQGYSVPCEESIQCTDSFGPNAECLKKKCICRPGYHFSEMQCWKDKGFKEQCTTNAECYIKEDGTSQKMECASSQCVCKPEYEPDFDNMRCSGVSLQAAVSTLLLLIFSKILA